MVLCHVQTSVLPIVKSNASNERVYQLSCGDQWNSDTVSKFVPCDD